MRPFAGPWRTLTALLAVAGPARPAVAYDLDPNSTESVTSIAKNMADDLLSFYKGDEPGHVPGLPPQQYFWWIGGAMMGALVEYWYYTKDDSYVETTKRGLLFQVGKYDDYMPDNQTLTEGNDDQGFWAAAVMSAAEYNFPEGGDDQPSWLGLAQAVFNTQAVRWDESQCGGGLRWQIYNWNKGWDYKNSISQGTFFSLAARLALYTGNDTYADWAVKSWDWMIDLEYIDKWWYVYDGAHIPNNCTDIVPWQFTYNAGVFILGAAAMYNYTESDAWKERLDGLLEGAQVFFRGPNEDIMEEVACESNDLCNVDQVSFKAYLARWMAATIQWYPESYDRLSPLLRASAVAAAGQCTGGANGRMCGSKWSTLENDGTEGIGQQMSAMEVTLSCMITKRDPILTSNTGGKSEGDPGAGGSDIGRSRNGEPPKKDYPPMTAGQRAGAAILTAVVIGLLLLGVFWLWLDETSDKGPVDQMRGLPSNAAAAAAMVPIAGASLSSRESQVMAEKGPGVLTAAEVGTKHVEEPGPGVAAPAAVKRASVARHSKRASNMPLGWPHNPSIRSSVVEPGQSGQSSSGESTRGTDDDEIRPAAPTH
ncbi:uncharacterized protein J7T54_003580 [Emericellopsis cladophorae]|uniref:mannan endo-1,6-alpha-mannosidase n=1 Tax=Emericellopsis cladophorae TaxID=2686198 RepID=A0A9P9Y3M5_9HYPO|nr:uncharacterized protein J7T54_003580 [Emericellopsis cladophorae]KAI6782568.1 hypothetical protein J7T54_003580 [Emericellopsis cladophorae]